MINEFELYHGIVLSKLIHSSREALLFQKFNQNDNAAYVINNVIGIYIKYCKKRLTPWRFTFLKIHQDTIAEMKSLFSEVFVLLVCNKDGIVMLDWLSLKNILDSTHERAEWIAVARNKNKMFSVNGSDGLLKQKICKTDFPDKICMYFNR